MNYSQIIVINNQILSKLTLIEGIFGSRQYMYSLNREEQKQVRQLRKEIKELAEDMSKEFCD
jgi:hypothetical protein